MFYVLFDTDAQKPLGVFNSSSLAQEARKTIIEKELAECLAVDPEDSGLNDLTDGKIQQLRDEIRDNFNIAVFPQINTFIGI